MGSLIVRFNDQRLTLDTDQTLGFGRTVMAPTDRRGWGYPGRFLELDADPLLHRVWGDLVWRHELWCVRSLGARDRVGVQLPGKDVIELEPLRPEDAAEGTEPDLLAVADPEFDVLLANGARTFRIRCEWAGVDADSAPTPLSGPATGSLGSALASSMTEVEYQILWVMAREYRHGTADGRPPEPLEYSRIARSLGHSSRRPANAAMERLVRRFRTLGLLPDDVEPDAQRQWMCRQAVDHDAFGHLASRYGELDD